MGVTVFLYVPREAIPQCLDAAGQSIYKINQNWPNLDRTLEEHISLAQKYLDSDALLLSFARYEIYLEI